MVEKNFQNRYWPCVGVDGAGEWREPFVFFCEIGVSDTGLPETCWAVDRCNGYDDGICRLIMVDCIKNERKFGALVQTWKDGPVVVMGVAGHHGCWEMAGGSRFMVNYDELLSVIAREVYGDDKPRPRSGFSYPHDIPADPLVRHIEEALTDTKPQPTERTDNPDAEREHAEMIRRCKRAGANNPGPSWYGWPRPNCP